MSNAPTQHVTADYILLFPEDFAGRPFYGKGTGLKGEFVSAMPLRIPKGVPKVLVHYRTPKPGPFGHDAEIEYAQSAILGFGDRD